MVCFQFQLHNEPGIFVDSNNSKQQTRTLHAFMRAEKPSINLQEQQKERGMNNIDPLEI
jgi:hypothetical protein